MADFHTSRMMLVPALGIVSADSLSEAKRLAADGHDRDLEFCTEDAIALDSPEAAHALNGRVQALNTETGMWEDVEPDPSDRNESAQDIASDAPLAQNVVGDATTAALIISQTGHWNPTESNIVAAAYLATHSVGTSQLIEWDDRIGGRLRCPQIADGLASQTSAGFIEKITRVPDLTSEYRLTGDGMMMSLKRLCESASEDPLPRLVSALVRLRNEVALRPGIRIANMASALRSEARGKGAHGIRLLIEDELLALRSARIVRADE